MDSGWAAAEGTAAKQFGAISRAQLVAHGLHRSTIERAVAVRRIVSLAPELFRFAASAPTWRQLGLGLTQLLIPGSALSHWTAGFLWGLPGIDSPERTGIHLSLPARRNRRLPVQVHIHRPRRAFESVDAHGLAKTRITRTLVDLAEFETEPRLEAMLDAAHHKFREIKHWLRSELDECDPKFVPGATRLRKLVDLRTGGALASPLETDLFRDVRAARLPRPIAQFDVRDGRGTFVCRPDLAWPAHAVAVFGDGYAWHDDRKTFDKDAAQRTRLAALGWSVVVVTATTRRKGQWIRDLSALLARTSPQKSLFDPVTCVD